MHNLTVISSVCIEVTDQIENEEQLLGLKGDEEQEAAGSQERKELDEDQVDTGMEMEADFDGDTFDLPEQQENKEDDNCSDNEEEIDRTMGDGVDPNEEVVDEKMWDNEEDEIDPNQEEEKFEEGSKMTGEKLDDEMRTKDQDEEDITGKEGSDEHDANQQSVDEKNEAPENADNGKSSVPFGSYNALWNFDSHRITADDKDNPINDDTEDKYEEKQGVDVRNDTTATDENEDDGTFCCQRVNLRIRFILCSLINIPTCF